MYVAKLMVSYLVKVCIYSKSYSDFTKTILRLCQNPTRIFTKITAWFSQHGWLIFTKSHSDFTKITIRFSPKSYSDFAKIPLRFSPKSLPDFHNITGWFSQNHTPTLSKSHSDFTKIADWFAQNHWLIFTKTRVDFEAPDCCFTVRRFKIAPSPIVRPACQKVSAVSSRACRVALTVFVLVCEKNLVLFTGSSCLAFHHFAVLR